MRRRCLDCPAIIIAGSRCPRCKAKIEASRAPQRSSYARHGWADAVKARDGYACTIAGCSTPFDRVQAHHTVALIAGGADTIENGRTLCHRHHLEAHHGG